MRILWVKVGGLWPADRGGRLRSLHMIRELSRRHAVTVATTHADAGEQAGLFAALADCQRIASFPHRMPKQGTRDFAVALARAWASPLPVDLWKARVPALRRLAHDLVRGGQVAVCVADFLAAIPNVPPPGPLPGVLFEHNVEHVIWQRLARTERRGSRRLLLELEWRKMRRAEARACAEATLALAVSEADAA